MDWGMFHYGFGVILVRRFERLRIGNGRLLAPRVIEDDRLEPLRSHHGPQPAARRDP
jgi:hypothetical protein